MDRSIATLFLLLFLVAWALVYATKSSLVLHGMLILFGLYLAGVVVYFSHILRKRIAAWPTSTAKLISARIAIRTQDFDHKFITYIPVVKYRYRIDNVEYEGSGLSIDDKGYMFHSIDQANEFLHDLGSRFEVHYNALDHGVSYVYPNVSEKRKKHYRGVLASGILLVLFSIITLAYSY